MELLDISVSKTLENLDRRTLNNNRFYATKGSSPFQWPRKYGKTIKQSVKNKNWELRKYRPTVVGE